MKKYSVLLATVSMVAISFAAQANEAALRQRQQEAAQEKSRAQAAAAASHGNTELSNTRTSHETSGRERHGSGSAHGRAEMQISEDPEKNARDGVPVPENTITPAGNTVTPAGNTVTETKGIGPKPEDPKGLGKSFGGKDLSSPGGNGNKDPKGGFDVGGKGGDDKKPGGFGLGDDKKTGGLGSGIGGEKKPAGTGEKNTVTPSGKNDTSKPDSSKGNESGKTEKTGGGSEKTGKEGKEGKEGKGGKEKLTGMAGEEGSGGGEGLGAGGGSNGSSGQPRGIGTNPNQTNPSRGDSGDERPARVSIGGSTVSTPAGNTGSAAGGGLRRENIGGAHVNPGGGTDGLPPRP